MHRAKVILESTVAVDGHTQVEFGHEGKERTCAVSMLDGPQADTQQPVDVLHLLLWEAHGVLLGCSREGSQGVWPGLEIRKGLPGT